MGARSGEEGDATAGKVMDPVDAYQGTVLIQENVRDLFEDAVALYDDGRYQSSVMFAIMAIEESLKGAELSIHFRRREGVTAGTWANLKKHDYKFTSVDSWVIENLESEGMKSNYADICREAMGGDAAGAPTVGEMVDAMKRSRDVHGRLQFVKESCMYQNWNRGRNRWTRFGSIGDGQRDLALFMLHTARSDYGLLVRSLDFALDTYIANNPKLSGLKGSHPCLAGIGGCPSRLASGEEALRRFCTDEGAGEAPEPTRAGGPGADGGGGRELISPAEAREGTGLMQESSKRLYDDAAMLHGRGRFRGAVILAVLSVEEASKGEYLSARAQRNEGLKERHWGRLVRHGYKLGKDDAMSGLPDQAGVRRFYRSRAKRRTITEVGKQAPTEEDIRSLRARVRELKPGLNLVKKRCVYHEWVEQHKRWDDFRYLPGGAQDDLAFCVLDMAKWQYWEFGVVAAGGRWHGAQEREGACWPELERVLDVPHRLITGENVLGAILQEGIVAIWPQVVTRNIAKECMDIVGHSFHDSPNWHPVVKAYFTATGSLARLPDGDYAWEADNAGQTYEGVPTMHARVEMSKAGPVMQCKRIVVNGAEYGAHDSRIAALLGVERVLSRWHGAEVSIERLAEAYAEIGVGTHIVEGEEAGAAIEAAVAAMDSGAIAPPKEIEGAVRGATPQGWDALEPATRCWIAAAYKRKPNALVLSGVVDPIRKSKIRDMAWWALTELSGAPGGQAPL